MLDTLEIVLNRAVQIPVGEQRFGVGQQRTGLDDLGSVQSFVGLGFALSSFLLLRHHDHSVVQTIPRTSTMLGRLC